MYKVKHGLVPDYLSAEAPHTRYGIVTMDYHVLKLYDMVSTLLDISLGPFLWSKLADSQRDSPSLPVFINAIRKLNHADIVINNSNCCNLCSQ